MKNESREKWEKKRAFLLLHFLIPHAYDAHSFLVDWWGLTPRSSIATAQEEQFSVLTFRERTWKRHIFQPAAPNAPRSQLLSHCIAHLLTPFKRVQLSGVSLSFASPGAFSRNYIALTLDCEKAEKKKRTREKLQLLAYVHVLYLYSKSKEKKNWKHIITDTICQGCRVDTTKHRRQWRTLPSSVSTRVESRFPPTFNCCAAAVLHIFLCCRSRLPFFPFLSFRSTWTTPPMLLVVDVGLLL